MNSARMIGHKGHEGSATKNTTDTKLYPGISFVTFVTFVAEFFVVFVARTDKKKPGTVEPSRARPSNRGEREEKLRGARGSATRRGGCGERLDGLDRLGARGCPCHAPGLHHEALLERSIDLGFDLERLLTHHFRYLGNDQCLGAVEHPLLAKRQTLRLAEERQALEHVGHVVNGSGPHLVRIVLESALPVLVIVYFAVAQQTEQALDLFVADGPAQPDAIDIADRDQDRRVVRYNAQVEEPARGSQN